MIIRFLQWLGIIKRQENSVMNFSLSFDKTNETKIIFEVIRIDNNKSFIARCYSIHNNIKYSVDIKSEQYSIISLNNNFEYYFNKIK